MDDVRLLIRCGGAPPLTRPVVCNVLVEGARWDEKFVVHMRGEGGVGGWGGKASFRSVIMIQGLLEVIP